MENRDKAAYTLAADFGYMTENCMGLTKREYAAIHCTTPVPDWFKPNISKEPKHPGYLRNVFGKNSEHPNKEFLQYWDDDNQCFLPPNNTSGEMVPEIPESLKIEVRNHLVKLKKFSRKHDRWTQEKRTETIKQWKYYFADLLLS